MSQLERKTLAQIITFWKPGSGEWSWADEYADLMGRHQYTTDRIRERVAKEGIHFVDYVAPVMLGNDGRVWDGHHRICIAIEQGIPELAVEVVT